MFSPHVDGCVIPLYSTLVNWEQFENASLPILVIVFGIVTFFNPLDENALFPIDSMFFKSISKLKNSFQKNAFQIFAKPYLAKI